MEVSSTSKLAVRLAEEHSTPKALQRAGTCTSHPRKRGWSSRFFYLMIRLLLTALRHLGLCLPWTS